ncbi:MAG: ABC transporter ATP-binding protein [Chloroflexi bacterium]|nr:ABC transporter ATP-binding protein [Chloroflexota bacterium]
MLRVENLKKVFNIDGQEDVQALRGVSFSILPGEFFTLLGPSGSGKSTLIRCVAGLESPEDGEIYIGDVLVYSKQKNVYVPTEQRPIGMVFQSYAIWPHMSVFDNVAFPLIHGARSRADRVPRSEVQGRVHEALSLVKLQDFGKRGPRSSAAASSSASPSPGRSSPSRGCCCSTSRSPTWTRSCARRRARSSRTWWARSTSRPSTSPTTRPRR